MFVSSDWVSPFRRKNHIYRRGNLLVGTDGAKDEEDRKANFRWCLNVESHRLSDFEEVAP